MDFLKELEFLRKLGLRVQIFGKDFKKLFKGYNDCKIFVVVIRSDEDKLYHLETLLKSDISKLRN
jgi:hypothetical protein